MTAAIGAWLAEPRGGGLHPSAEEQKALARIYPASSESPIWVDSTGHPTRSAQEALTAFVDAAAEGLDPADYRALELSARRTNLDAVSRPDPREVAVFDVEVSLSIMRYLRHFHRGRVDPSELGLLLTLPVDEHDYAGLARDAALKGRVRETIASMTPPLVQYRSLRSVLPRYRALALIDAPILPQAPAKSIKPGDTAPGLDILRNRLIALHDLPETAAPLADPPRYEGHLVEGVRRFQIRHGLESDGVLGKATWAALNVPFPWRVRQIEMAMERLRWLPHLGERPFIAVNIPMFRLWGWDRVPETGAPDFGMGVIVGKAALDTKTPVFLGGDEVPDLETLLERPEIDSSKGDPSPAQTQPGVSGTAGDGDGGRPGRRCPKGGAHLRERGSPRPGEAAVATAAGNQERSGTDRVHISKRYERVPARHARARTVRSHSSRLLSRLRPRRGSVGSGRMGAQGSTRVDAREDPRRPPGDSGFPGALDPADPSGHVLRDRRGDARGQLRSFRRRHLRTRLPAGPGPRREKAAS